MHEDTFGFQVDVPTDLGITFRAEVSRHSISIHFKIDDGDWQYAGIGRWVPGARGIPGTIRPDSARVTETIPRRALEMLEARVGEEANLHIERALATYREGCEERVWRLVDSADGQTFYVPTDRLVSLLRMFRGGGGVTLRTAAGEEQAELEIPPPSRVPRVALQ